MKSIKWIFAAMLLGLAASGPALADPGHHGGYHGHGDHVGIGVYWGAGWGWPWYYPPPYYYPPTVVAVPSAPPVYIEQSQPAPVYQDPLPQAPVPQAYAPAPQENSWYYCASSRTYYPYVRDCPEGWQRVAPQPPKPQ
jgi:hypothetical protein